VCLDLIHPFGQFPLVGRSAVKLADKWDAGAPDAYFGIAIPDFPNYFSEHYHT
jgi:hypothetical protein